MGKQIILVTVILLGGGMLLQSPVLALDAVSIPAAALVAGDNDVDYFTNGVRMAVDSSSDDQFLQAPVELPHKAVIRRIILEGKDSSGSGSIDVGLREFRRNTYLDLVRVSTSANETPGDFRRGMGLSHEVNNSRYSYGIEVVINNGNDWNAVWYYKVVIKYVTP